MGRRTHCVTLCFSIKIHTHLTWDLFIQKIIHHGKATDKMHLQVTTHSWVIPTHDLFTFRYLSLGLFVSHVIASCPSWQVPYHKYSPPPTGESHWLNMWQRIRWLVADANRNCATLAQRVAELPSLVRGSCEAMWGDVAACERMWLGEGVTLFLASLLTLKVRRKDAGRFWLFF